MRLSLVLILGFVFAPAAFGQTPEIDAAVKAKLATLKYLEGLRDKDGGYKLDADAKPSLRATNAAVKAIKYLGGKIPEPEKTAKFVLGCYDEKTGAFAEPGGKPDVTVTSIGVIAAMELGIEKEKLKKSMDYLKENAKTFEEMRIGAAAVESWGIKEPPFDLKPWIVAATAFWKKRTHEDNDVPTVAARDIGSSSAMILRLGGDLDTVCTSNTMSMGQLHDGGWGKVVNGMRGDSISDLETTYRIVRAFKHMPDAVKIKDFAALRKYLGKHRNDDGGYAVKPGEKSNASGTYYAVTILHWLEGLEKKK